MRLNIPDKKTIVPKTNEKEDTIPKKSAIINDFESIFGLLR